MDKVAENISKDECLEPLNCLIGWRDGHTHTTNGLSPHTLQEESKWRLSLYFPRHQFDSMIPTGELKLQPLLKVFFLLHFDSRPV